MMMIETLITNIKELASQHYKGNSPMLWYACISPGNWRAFIINRETKEILRFSQLKSSNEDALKNLESQMKAPRKRGAP